MDSERAGVMTADFKWLYAAPAPPNAAVRRRAEQRQASLTKPAGSLGKLEEVAVQLAALQDTDTPRVERVYIAIYAGDHGVAEENVSAFPQAVTGEMVRNFVHGGAAISVLARELRAIFEVINLGTVNSPATISNVSARRIAASTANFTKRPAMEKEQLAAALSIGRDTVRKAKEGRVDLFIGGEMGIANTTSATALACALLGIAPETVAGRGTGVDAAGMSRKINAVQRALDLHADYLRDPLEALQRVGGFEIAALTGSYIACAQQRIPALIDGFIATSAALAAVKICPAAAPWFLYAHKSAEPGHRTMLAALDARPLLDLDMRLGEGSGAAVAVPLLRLACATHNTMATFADAHVSGGH
jgi:nicotinate-nucleotide--dimethylbenzimidazole phosphoribosyltransferase